MRWNKTSFFAAVALLATGCPGDDTGTTDSVADTSSGGATTTSGPSTSGSPSSTTMDPPDETTGDPPGETTGDPPDETTSGGTTAAEGSTTMAAIPIPDPGAEMDMWQSAGDISSPDIAWPVGIATIEQPYIEGTVAADGNAFFVFEAGPALTLLDIRVFGGIDSDFIHLHDGSGGVFGAEIPADTGGVTAATFTTVPGNVYVLEVHLPEAGFF